MMIPEESPAPTTASNSPHMSSSEGATPSSRQHNQPSGVAGSSLVTLPSSNNLEVLIAEESYHLPAPGEPPIEVLLGDGATAQLSSTSITLWDQTLTIPDVLNGAYSIPTTGRSVVVQPGPSTPPIEGGSNGNKPGLFGAIGAIAGSAGAAAESLGAIGTHATNFLGGATGAAAGLTGSIRGATDTVGGVVSSINGVQDAFPKGQISQAGLDVFTDAQNAGRRCLDKIRSIQSVLPKIDTMSSEGQIAAKDFIRDLVKPDGVLQQAKSALQAMEDFPWEEPNTPTATPEPPASGKSTGGTTMEPTSGSAMSSKQSTEASSTVQSTSSVQSASQSSTSSSATPTPTSDEVRDYSITTKDGTPHEEFKNFTDSFDDSKGFLLTYDDPTQQMYLTSMNETQAAMLRRTYDFILCVVPHEVYLDGRGDLEEFRAVEYETPRPPTVALDTDEWKDPIAAGITSVPDMKIRPRLFTAPDNDAPWWKKMMSAPPRNIRSSNSASSSDPAYRTDDSGGRQTTIYVLDNGFDLEIANLQAGSRSIRTHTIPNEVAFGRTPSLLARAVPENIGLGDHGTMMAGLAGGRDTGMAPNADLYLIKTKGHYRHQTGDRLGTTGYTYFGLRDVLNVVRRDIRSRLAANPDAKSVVNMSWGINIRQARSALEIAQMQLAFEEFLDFCKSRNVPVVVAAGNKVSHNLLNEALPQKLQESTEAMILVGGVLENGQIWDGTCDDPTGSITVYAPGYNVRVPGLGGVIPDSAGERAGTSHAAAIISGLIAYLYGLPSLPNELVGRTGTGGIKGFLEQLAWVRTTAPLPSNWVVPPKVPYNLANGYVAPGSCNRKRWLDGKRQADDICSLPSTTSQSSTSNSATPTPTSSNTTSASSGNTTSTASSGTATSTASSSNTISTASSNSTAPTPISSSATPTSTAPFVHEWIVASYHNTTLETFKRFMDEHDQGKGILTHFENVGYSMYVTRMNATQAAEVKEKYGFIQFVLSNWGSTELEESYEEYRAFERPHELNDAAAALHQLTSSGTVRKDFKSTANAVRTRELSDDSSAPWWKRMISAPVRKPDETGFDPKTYPSYRRDDSGGRGTTIYVLDDGFDTSIANLQADGRKISQIVTPNWATFREDTRLKHAARIVKETIEFGSHGTVMAGLAGGRVDGVAPNADLCLVKTKGHIRHTSDSTRLSVSGHRSGSVSYFLEQVRYHIEARLRENPQARSVINMSWGIETKTRRDPGELEFMEASLFLFLEFCKDNNIPVVVAAGNKETADLLNDATPQKLQRATGTMIIVGAVGPTGQIWEGTRDDPDGHIDVYAPGEDISVPTVGGKVESGSGTSQAAAIVSGLIAYYYGLPTEDLPPLNQPGTSGMRGLIKQFAWVRTTAAQATNWKTPPKVVYNLAHGVPAASDSCNQARGLHERQADNVCSLASTLDTSTRYVGSHCHVEPRKHIYSRYYQIINKFQRIWVIHRRFVCVVQFEYFGTILCYFEPFYYPEFDHHISSLRCIIFSRGFVFRCPCNRPNVYQDSGSNVYQDSGSNVYQDSGSNVYQDSGSNVYQDSGSNVYQDSGSNIDPGS
ncbi:hypothetical protein NX059_000463 [Plenodomus lindquistii]|nr:hypothetical protein NX059_000463 [Plenodomus lindquistii]